MLMGSPLATPGQFKDPDGFLDLASKQVAAGAMWARPSQFAEVRLER